MTTETVAARAPSAAAKKKGDSSAAAVALPLCADAESLRTATRLCQDSVRRLREILAPYSEHVVVPPEWSEVPASKTAGSSNCREVGAPTNSA